MKISQVVLCAVLLGGHSRRANAFSGGQFKKPTIVPKGESSDDEPTSTINDEPVQSKSKLSDEDVPPSNRRTTSSSRPLSPQPIVSGDRANSDRYQNSVNPWTSHVTIGGGSAQTQQPPARKGKPRMSRAASAIPIISSGNNASTDSNSNQPTSFNTSGVSRGAIASMTSSAPPTGGTTVSHAATSSSGRSVGSVGQMTSSQPPTGGTTVSHAGASASGMSVGSVGQMTSTQPPTGGTTVTHDAVVSGDRACSDRYQNSMMNSDQGNRSSTYRGAPAKVTRAAKTVPVVGGGGTGGADAGGAIAGQPTSNTSGVSRGSIASMTTSAPVKAGRSALAPTPAADATPVVSGDRACADRYQNSIASTIDPNRSSTYRGPAKVTRAAKTIPTMPDGSSAGGSPWVPKAGKEDDAAAAATPKKTKPNSRPRRGAVDESIKPIISGQVGANVNDRYGNSMTQD